MYYNYEIIKLYKPSEILAIKVKLFRKLLIITVIEHAGNIQLSFSDFS